MDKGADLKLNWLSPLLLIVPFASLFFILVHASLDTEMLASDIAASSLTALFPCGLAFAVSIHLRNLGADPIWWRPKRVALLLIPSFVAIAVRMMMTAPGNSIYAAASRHLSQNNYAAATVAFEALITDYPNNPHARQAQEQLPTLYVSAIKQYEQAGQYFTAVSALGDKSNLGKSVPASTVTELYEEVMRGLSQDSGSDGQALIAALRDSACKKLANAPQSDICLTPGLGCSNGGVRLSDVKVVRGDNEGGKALTCQAPCPQAVCGYPYRFELPAQIAATKPSELRYIVVSRRQDRLVEKCDYFSGAAFPGQVAPVVGTLSRNQPTLRFEIVDVVSGASVASKEFQGGLPAPCPDRQTFSSQRPKPSISGDDPDNSLITSWLLSVVK